LVVLLWLNTIILRGLRIYTSR